MLGSSQAENLIYRHRTVHGAPYRISRFAELGVVPYAEPRYHFYLYYGDNFKIECPTGSGKLMNLFGVSKEISTVSFASSCAMNMVGGLSIAARKSSRVIHSGATTSTSLNTFMATMALGWAPVTKPAGPDSSLNSSSSAAFSMLSECRKWAVQPRSLRKPAPLGREDGGMSRAVGRAARSLRSRT